MSGFLYYLDNRELRKLPSSDNDFPRFGTNNNGLAVSSLPARDGGASPYDDAAGPNQAAVAVASDLTARSVEWRDEESRAAGVSLSAVASCP